MTDKKEKIKIDWTTGAAEYANSLKKELSSLEVDEDGDIWNIENANYDVLIEARKSCTLAFRCALVWDATKEERYRAFGERCMHYARRCAVYHNGVYFWPQEYVASLCSLGRSLRELYYAARIFDDGRIMEFLGAFLSAWPYLPQEHRFVERFVPGLVKESNKRLPQPFNMELEGAVDSWLVGKELNNKLLMERGKDMILNFFLPHQIKDGVDKGLWHYGPDRQMERSYSLYALTIICHLLRFPEWHGALKVPVHESFEGIRRTSAFDDGSVYASVHWGWNHIGETTVAFGYVGWMLTKYCGYNYGNDVARALQWVRETEIGAVDYNAELVVMSPVSSVDYDAETGFGTDCWGYGAQSLLLERVSVEGEKATPAQIVDTLRNVDENMSLRNDTGSLAHPLVADRWIQHVRKRIDKLASQEGGSSQTG